MSTANMLGSSENEWATGIGFQAKDYGTYSIGLPTVRTGPA